MDNYNEELELNSPRATKMLLEVIREMIKSEIKKAQFNRMMICKVISADNTAKTATVQLVSDGTNISGVKNRTGVDLTTDNLCYLLFVNGSSSNFVLTIKC